ncbi:RagB/SusD family nutrient uptake outer membrane protein [Pedobacter rhodius]|uniref:RagB/SusD family nutrient uptake outer membrane protein n=1 Tax=Pedobacter rhodius TaxID=3004098 RepID=A0ABT4L062_9SPHI|nr:RagB/SusD family nutrient uptake outer membrane protein [Pedobacter sp. SJ11]MCZ4223468.1 RagB/SusD family nutrient uptake outer membrane protein [Pedobacter sp. SJ11]
MKYYIILFSGICSVLMFGSCKKYLATEPTDFAITSNYYSNKTEIDFAISGIYSNLKNSALSRDWMQLSNAASDEGYHRSAPNGPATFSSTGGNGTITAYWDNCYSAINYINTFLENIGSASGKIDQSVIDKAKGEAYFLRGYYYFLLVQWYGGVPLRLSASKTVEEGQMAKASLKEIYDQIIADMILAEGLLKDQTSASLGYADRVTQDAVQGILARVCLHAAGEPLKDVARYKDALFWSNKLISSGQHTLLPQFSKPFVDEAKNLYNTENIWEIGYSYSGPAVTQNQGGPVGCFVGVRMISEAVSPTRGVDTGFCEGNLMVHPRLLKAYQPGDLRRDRTIANYNFTSSTTSAVVVRNYVNETVLWDRNPAKWRREEEDLVSRGILRGSAINFPLLRYSDVLLMFAEAENYINGPTTAALNAINLVRQRAFSTTNIINNVNVVNASSTNFTSAPLISSSGGGGTGASFVAFVTAGKLSVSVINPGSGYSSAPVLTIGKGNWTTGTPYALNDYVAVGTRQYRITTAGTSTATAPTNTTGASAAATTGAVFTYVGERPTSVTAVLSNHAGSVLLSGLNAAQLTQAIKDERYRELAFECLRYQDLKRWGILYSTVKDLANDIAGGDPNIPAAPAASSGNAIAPVNQITPNNILWPIPLKEVTLNKKITQNPGY